MGVVEKNNPEVFSYKVPFVCTKYDAVICPLVVMMMMMTTKKMMTRKTKMMILGMGLSVQGLLVELIDSNDLKNCVAYCWLSHVQIHFDPN